MPELGTLKARHVPAVLLTSNGTRELSDALRRRGLYHWLDYPTLAREIAILRSTLPGAEMALVEQAVAFVQRLRKLDLGKTPGVAETLDCVRALQRLALALWTPRCRRRLKPSAPKTTRQPSPARKAAPAAPKRCTTAACRSGCHKT